MSLAYIYCTNLTWLTGCPSERMILVSYQAFVLRQGGRIKILEEHEKFEHPYLCNINKDWVWHCKHTKYFI